jgi:hypothetical protein
MLILFRFASPEILLQGVSWTASIFLTERLAILICDHSYEASHVPLVSCRDFDKAMYRPEKRSRNSREVLR